MEGEVTYKGQLYRFELDEKGDLWITYPLKLGKINYAQEKRIIESDNLKKLIINFLIQSGY